MISVRIMIVELPSGRTHLIERNSQTKEQLNKLWAKYLPSQRGASTSNLGYEPKDFPKYNTMTGYVEETNSIVSWTQWEEK